jgi:hypothetical protein
MLSKTTNDQIDKFFEELHASDMKFPVTLEMKGANGGTAWGRIPRKESDQIIHTGAELQGGANTLASEFPILVIATDKQGRKMEMQIEKP